MDPFAKMLAVKVRTPTGVLSFNIAEDSTFEQLKIEIAEKGNIDNDFDVLAGFPLKPLTLIDEDLIRGHICNNEVVRIQAKELAGQQSQGHSKYRPSKKTTAATSSSFPSSSSKPKPTGANEDSSGSGFGAKIATIHSTASSNRNKKSSSSSGKSRSSGYTAFAPGGIRNGAAPQRSANRVRQATRKPQRTSLASDQPNNTESDISEHLISAVSGGSTKRDKILRKVFRNAVEYQYSSSKAVARLQAVYAGNYTITPSSTAKVLGSGMSTQLDVKYPRGPGQRTFFTETVELLGEELLRALLKVAVEDTEGEGREVLKPMNLARCSPRIFWSIVHRYGNNLVSNIRQLLAGVDDECLWLTERKRDLSDKAKENAEQERQRLALREMRKRKHNPNETIPEVVPTVDNNHNEKLIHSNNINNKSSNNNNNSSNSVKQLSPKICKLFASLSLSLCFPPDETVVTVVKNILLNQFRRHLSEESLSSEVPWIFLLANVNDIHAFHQQFVTDMTSSSFLEEEIELWVASAQHFTLQYLWQIVCGNGSERLRQALASLRVRTPVEMLLWRAVPGGLYSGLNQQDSGLQSMLFSWHEEMTHVTNQRWNLEHVQFMIALCQEIVDWGRSWIQSYDRIVADDDTKEREENVQEGDECAGEESISFEEWVKDASAHMYIGRRCRIVVRSSSQLEDEESKEQEKENYEEKIVEELGNYWEDGTVIAYLPPTEEEPEALWRVQLDENFLKDSSVTKKLQIRYEDLEEHEVEVALQRYANALSMTKS